MGTVLLDARPWITAGSFLIVRALVLGGLVLLGGLFVRWIGEGSSDYALRSGLWLGWGASLFVVGPYVLFTTIFPILLFFGGPTLLGELLFVMLVPAVCATIGGALGWALGALFGLE
jgi:hypothetical protein